MRVVLRDAAIWKERLISISWLIRALNEPISRAANIEDNCTGKFFEARFKRQALLDEKAILAAMTYVDLNPIRAQIAATPEESEFTSIKTRMDNLKTKTPDSFLASFTGDEKGAATSGVPYHLLDFIELADWTGRAVRYDKRGTIDYSIPPILKRPGLETSDWLVFAIEVESQFGNLGRVTEPIFHCLGKCGTAVDLLLRGKSALFLTTTLLPVFYCIALECLSFAQLEIRPIGISGVDFCSNLVQFEPFYTFDLKNNLYFKCYQDWIILNRARLCLLTRVKGLLISQQHENGYCNLCTGITTTTNTLA